MFNYANNSANQRTSVTNVDGSYWVYSYDTMGQVTSGKKYWSDGSTVAGQQFDYTFDDIGNRKTTTRDTQSATYTPNNLNQYTRRDVPGYVNVLGTATNTATVSLWSKESTALFTPTTRKGDYFRGEMPFNNATGAMWLTITNVAVLSNSASADIVTNISGKTFLPRTAEEFGYDQDGNLTNDGRWAYTWDAENRLVKQESLSSAPTASKRKLDFVYDFNGRRLEKTVWTNNGSSYVAQYTNRFVYDGWNLAGILNPQSSILQSFAWGLDLSGSLQGAGGVGGLLICRDQSTLSSQPSTNFVAYDGNGNVANLVNAASGAVSASYEYGPFGEVLRTTGTVAKSNPFRFSTKYQDDESDYLYYGYRSYNPSSGRWLRRDPISELGFKRSNDYASRKHRDEANPYAYIANHPVDLLDILGLYAGGATTGEIKDIITEIGPIDAASVKDTPGDAMKCASNMPAKSLWGGEGDAVRHCTWLCLMSKKVGMKQALAVAEIHEKHHPPPAVPKPPKGYSSAEDWSKADSEMDNANNAYGVQLGSACGLKDCCSACNQALKQGQLKVNQPGGYDFGP